MDEFDGNDAMSLLDFGLRHVSLPMAAQACFPDHKVTDFNYSYEYSHGFPTIPISIPNEYSHKYNLVFGVDAGIIFTFP